MSEENTQAVDTTAELAADTTVDTQVNRPGF